MPQSEQTRENRASLCVVTCIFNRYSKRPLPGSSFLTHRLALAAAILLAVASLCAAQSNSSPSAAQSEPATTTQKDQTDLSITVYNQNLALVRDVRQIRLRAGAFPLHFEDVAASINPATVHLRSLTDPSKLSVLEQDYEYDLLDPQKLLQKYVGREVTLVRAEQQDNSTKYTETKALLLSDNNGPVWKIGNEIVTGMASDSYRFPDLPDNLYSRPTLIWTLDNPAPTPNRRSLLPHRKHPVERGLRSHRRPRRKNRRPRRLGHAHQQQRRILRQRTLQLVAGQVNQVAPPSRWAMMKCNGRYWRQAAAAPSMTQENFSEYHLYTRDAPHLDPQQRIEADQPAQRRQISQSKRHLSSRPALLLPQLARASEIPSRSP